MYCSKSSLSYNHGHNILRLFDTLPSFLYTTSETKRHYQKQTWYIKVASRVAEQLKTQFGNTFFPQNKHFLDTRKKLLKIEIKVLSQCAISSYLLVKLAPPLKSRLLPNIFYCFCMLVNKNWQTLQEKNLGSHRIKKAKFSGYYFFMNTQTCRKSFKAPSVYL